MPDYQIDLRISFPARDTEDAKLMHSLFMSWLQASMASSFVTGLTVTSSQLHVDRTFDDVIYERESAE